ncbi:MAG: chemotaxis response regulator protein-glutamate methylesterase [Spirochaetes bacterium GWB1_48_6]|nr:MAG: chemotaxis response regulator protein-glutamate methylesterase [Spirochaetes bacterium GWB1_48_6]
MAETGPIKVLIVDDSALMRNLIGKIIESDPELEVIGKALNGAFALRKLETLSPDVIILDLEMPEMNGIEFLRHKKEIKKDMPVIILSSIARKGAEVTMEALSLGASDFLTKPSGSISEDIHLVAKQLVELVKIYGTRYQGGEYVPRSGAEPFAAATQKPVEIARPVYEPPQSSLPTIKSSIPGQRPLPQGLRAHHGLQLLAMGISTGGPNALRGLFQALPGDFPLPIVVVQHMPAGFTAEFAKSLDRVCALDVKEAEDGDLIKRGRILIAPGDYHIFVEKKSLASILRVVQSAPVNGHRPSVGVLFDSVAEAYGSKTMAVIMTGMGRDGAVEIGKIYKAGGLTLGQDEASSVVYGMPRVALEMGHLEEVISLKDMASKLQEYSKQFN